MMTSRRRTLTMGLAALAAPCVARDAAADCLLPDPAKGIVFTRKDGSRGLARREGDGAVVIDYVTNRGDWLDRRRVTNGVFEVARFVEESEYPVVGATAPDYTWTHSPKVVAPEDGAAWTGHVKEVVEVTISDANVTVERQRRRRQASYRFFDPREVTLSGCTLEALTAETEWIDGDTTISLRYVCYPRLGLGLETRRNGKGNRITALHAA